MKKQVVIIGAGFGGLNTAKVLAKNKNFNVVIIDKANHHLFQPLLYQVATAALSPRDIASPIREIFRKAPNITTLMSTVTAIDKEAKHLVLQDGQKIHFDYLVIAPGNHHSYFGHADWEAFAPGLKTLRDALHIREKILRAFEVAETTKDESIVSALLTFVIIGGGPTGVEMAGSVAEIAHQSLKKNFRKIDPNKTKIYLIEGYDQLLGSYPKFLAKRAQQDLEKRGVSILLNTRVTQITADGVYLDQQFIPSKNIIWAAGNTASPLLKSLAVPLDKMGRVIVEKDLSLSDFPDIFVIGDAAFYQTSTGVALPGIAPVAVQQGKFVGKLISKEVNNKSRPHFHYVDYGMMAVIGKYDALVLSGPLQSSGFLAWLAWCFIHIYFLIGFRNRSFVFLHWAFYFFNGQRDVRLIVSSDGANG